MEYANSTSKANQSRLAQFCRDGNLVSVDGVNTKHVEHYRKLVYNVVSDSLSTAYPLTEQFLSEQEWTELVDNFWTNHKCQNPQIWQMPLEFLEYFKINNIALLEKYPFIVELLWFEWLEIFFFMRADESSPFSFSTSGNLDKDKIIINPEFSIEVFHYPVFRKSAKEISEADKSQFFLCVHREPSEGNVVFTEITAPFAAMLESLKAEPQSIFDLLQETCKQMNIAISSAIMKKTNLFFQNAFESKLILGFSR